MTKPRHSFNAKSILHHLQHSWLHSSNLLYLMVPQVFSSKSLRDYHTLTQLYSYLQQPCQITRCDSSRWNSLGILTTKMIPAAKFARNWSTGNRLTSYVTIVGSGNRMEHRSSSTLVVCAISCSPIASSSNSMFGSHNYRLLCWLLTQLWVFVSRCFQ